jgi:hypothetical protein
MPRDWRYDLAAATAQNVDDPTLQALVKANGYRVRDLAANAWRSSVRYVYGGPHHVIGSWASCRRNGGACADAAAFVAALAVLVGDGGNAFVCTEVHGTRADYHHARTTWGGRVVDPTADESAVILGGCHRVATAAQLDAVGRGGRAPW